MDVRSSCRSECAECQDFMYLQKQYLAAMTGVLDHDTSSSGSTDDSGRGPSEEGGEYILRHSEWMVL